MLEFIRPNTGGYYLKAEEKTKCTEGPGSYDQEE